MGSVGLVLALTVAACSGPSSRSTSSHRSSVASSDATAGGARSGFLAFADAGTGEVVQAQIADAMTRWVHSGHRADALVEAGDDVYDTGDPSRFAATLDAPYAALRPPRPLWVALGNHDVQAGHGAEQLRYLGLPDLPYAKELSGVQLLFLDANHPDEAQARWLEQQLSAPGPPLRVVVFHQPAYSCAEHGSTPAVDQWWVPVLEAHRVALVINGHDHYYERFRSAADVTYVVTGGGGARLYQRRADCTGVPASLQHASVHEFVGVEVHERSLTLTAVTSDSRVIDQATITR